mgnify:CR=1 FL=1
MKITLRELKQIVAEAEAVNTAITKHVNTQKYYQSVLKDLQKGLAGAKSPSDREFYENKIKNVQDVIDKLGANIADFKAGGRGKYDLYSVVNEDKKKTTPQEILKSFFKRPSRDKEAQAIEAAQTLVDSSLIFKTDFQCILSDIQLLAYGTDVPDSERDWIKQLLSQSVAHTK